MKNQTVVSAGEVLTVALLNKIDKAAYQFGGLKVEGEKVKKTAFNLEAKTTVIIEKKFVKTNVDNFLADFAKTMNAWYFNIKLI